MSQKLSVALVVLFCLLAVGLAELRIYQPGWLSLHQEASLANVGHLVDHVPTAVSHQSSTIVHRSAPRITPLLAPAVRTTYLQYPSWSYPLYNGALYRK
ncbi:uncharacterized protein Dana_GF24188 [Drosophila ananassae]|uniref:Uncharacterized protein n=1 Tax=Drosophila ananassae TaxID=7217 RepID=B3M8K9_DROAN|nr:uncharacterized protein LOC6506821 [Drosophila ananassae]EDV39983.1 uncharacterized protein Dana_GF24188 [Drosophila ananassae]